jgi:WD40 repeat protein/serine/threonine protein kinase
MTSMSRPPLQRVEELFHQAVHLAPAERSTFLDAQCGGDTALRVAVEELLEHDDPGRTESFLAGPVARARAERVPDTEAMFPASTGPAPPPPAVPGYEILGELGRGGMGIVYQARQVSLNRLVALKTLLAGAAVTPEQLARFRTEAEALARLQHPNIVQVYEVGTAEGQPFFAMEYVDGGSLAQALTGGRWPVGDREAEHQAAQLLETLARALHAVHQCGIVHRDLKPANILLQLQNAESRIQNEKPPPGSAFCIPHSAFCIPKVTDFGLARVQAAERRLTQTGQAMGTPSYMSPEQARGAVGTVGPATDIYALGAILYELLTGRPPFEDVTPAQTLARVLDAEPVSPARLRPSLARDLVTICLKCLEKEPSKRYASALALAEDLRRFQNGEPIRARPVHSVERAWRWCRRRPVVAALLGLSAGLALALVISVLLYNARLREVNVRLEEALTKTERQVVTEHRQLVLLHVTAGMRDLNEGDSFTALLWLTEALALDGDRPDEVRKHRVRIGTLLRQCPRLVQFWAGGGPVLCARLGERDGWVAAADEKNAIHVWNMRTGEPVGPALTPSTAVSRAAFSADGRLLATATGDGTARVWDVATGAARTPALPQGGRIEWLGFSADGGALLIRRVDFQIRFWKMGARPPVSWRGLPGSALRYSGFSDDGRWAFTLNAGGEGRVWDVATRQPVGTSLAAGAGVRGAAFSPDGGRVALVGPDHAVRVWDVATGRPVGEPLRHTHSVNRVAFSRTGDRIVTASTDHAARVWQLSTGRLLVPPLRHDSPVEYAAFSPDGRRVVTGGDDNRARVWDAATGEAITPPLLHNGSVGWAAFGRDGGRLLTVGMDGSARLWELAGPAGRQIGTRRLGKQTKRTETTSPDGRRLLRWGRGNIARLIDAATGKPLGRTLHHRSFLSCGAFSADGRRVATGSDDKTARVWDTATGDAVLPPLLHRGSVSAVAFSSDGFRLITAAEDHTARVWDAVTGEPLTPSLRHPRQVVSASFRADGNQALTVCSDGVVRSWNLRPDERPVADLRRLACVLAGCRLRPEQRLVPAAPAELSALWREVTRGKRP